MSSYSCTAYHYNIFIITLFLIMLQRWSTSSPVVFVCQSVLPGVMFGPGNIRYHKGIFGVVTHDCRLFGDTELGS